MSPVIKSMNDYMAMFIFICGGVVGFIVVMLIVLNILNSIDSPHYTRPQKWQRQKEENKRIKQKERQARIMQKKIERAEKKERKRQEREEKRKSKGFRRISEQPEVDSWTEINAMADGEDIESAIDKKRKTQDDAYEYVARSHNNSRENFKN